MHSSQQVGFHPPRPLAGIDLHLLTFTVRTRKTAGYIPPCSVSFRLRVTPPAFHGPSLKNEQGFRFLKSAPCQSIICLRIGWRHSVLAESDGVGFEPTVGLPLLLISSQVH